MTELKSEYDVTIAGNPSTATKEGTVLLEVTKAAPWFTMSWNRQGLTHGITAVPSGSLIVEIPVEGVIPGGTITIEQLAELLIGLMSAVMPTCNLFIDAVENEFGHKDKVEDF